MSSGADEQPAVAALREGVVFYSSKTQKLAAEVEKLQAELAKSRSIRDQLDEALQELQRESPHQGQASEDQQEDAEPTGHAAAPPPGSSRKTGSTKRSRSAPRSSSKGRNHELWREVLQVLATAGRPMHVKEIAAALGRPTKDKAGLSAVETIRSTCKRQVKHERAVEGPIGVFAIAREPGNLRGVA